ncbi:MAG: TldD/PmbA family protein [Archaeoglobaceae archaeon]
MEWELFSEKVVSFSAEIEAGKLKMLYKHEQKSYAVRVIENGKLGFSAGKDLEKLMEEARKMARISEERLKSFPLEKAAKVDGIYDRRFEELNRDFIREECEILLSSVEKAKIANAVITHGITETSIKNSLGADLFEKSTFSFFSLETLYGEGNGYAQTASRELKLDIEGIARYAEELAITASKAEKIDPGYYDLVLMPYAIHQLFSHTLYPSLSAENVARGRSSVSKGTFLGEIRIIDDATISGGLFSYSFDDEGVMARRKVLVDKSVLCFYTDWKNSDQFGATGNGLRTSVDSYPMPLPSNVITEFEGKTDEDSAIVVHSIIGAHTANAISGDFSVECLNAEIDGKGVKGAMIYGNIFELLKRISGICGKKEQVENTITSPIRFESVRVV